MLVVYFHEAHIIACSEAMLRHVVGRHAAGRRKNVAFDTLAEAANYARFACAAYAVVEYQDTRWVGDPHTLASV